MRSDVVKFKTLDGSTVYDSVDDWGMTLTHCDEQKPAPKFNRIDVPGTNGSVDVSAALSGDIPFEDRTVELTFFKLCTDHDAAYALAGDVAAAVHGKQMQLQTPDARTDGDTWYIGDVEITECRFEDRGCEVDVRAVCSPFRLSADGGSVDAPTGQISELAEGGILAVTSDFKQLAREVYSRFDVGAGWPASAPGVALCFAANSNLFDLDNATLRGVTIRTGTGTSWVKSNNIAQDGQRVAFGGVNANWVERAAVVATSASSVPLSGGCRVFPFCDDTRARVWFFSDAITDKQSSVTADGYTYQAGARVWRAEMAWGDIGSNGVFPNGSFVSSFLAAPSVGSAWNGQYIDFEISPYTSEIYIDLAGITATDVYALIAFYKADETAPASWLEPNVTVGIAQLPQNFRCFNDSSANEFVTDSFCNSIANAYATFFSSSAVSSRVELQKVADLPDSAYIQSCAASSSGETVRFDTPMLTRVYAHQMQTIEIDAGAQPAYPTATTSVRTGAVVEYNGNTYLIPAGSTVELDALLNRGANTVRVSTIPSVPSVTLTWPIGVL